MSKTRRPFDFAAIINGEGQLDRERYYLTGISWGGIGAWTFAADMPSHWAAVAPFCGQGDPTKAAQIAGTPIWTFVNLKETHKHLLDGTKNMVNALREIRDNNLRYTYFWAGNPGNYKNNNHDCWSKAYNDEALESKESKDEDFSPQTLYGWFLTHRLAVLTR